MFSTATTQNETSDCQGAISHVDEGSDRSTAVPMVHSLSESCGPRARQLHPRTRAEAQDWLQLPRLAGLDTGCACERGEGISPRQPPSQSHTL
eukprot:201284-Pyramimonas_sp.AAC.1